MLWWGSASGVRCLRQPTGRGEPTPYGQKIGTYLFTGDYTSLLSLAVHIKESSVEVWMGSKDGLLKALIGLRKIAECHFSSIIEDPQRPNHSYTLLSCRLATLWFVDDEGIGLQLFGQGNRFTFTYVKKS